ncbi:flagellar basal body-associated FliL family protein [Cellulomonas sp. ATA003]|uniref:flagellar basal body-associated FliL family protein n=1 Tax=Cellulomonas sp. ATA003 TaxID=3073064 RepID=UPI0028730BC3|nr:flagellar basal body-associated FliL family protein [Cellulomonas sp. ATA003]WNB85233.1 flagellar basal body-associated FliL family protein [Cellulomonas sp. ATA003]
MTTEQRVMVGGRRPLSEAAGRGAAAPEAAPEPPKKGKKGVVVIAVVAVLVAAAAAWFFLLKPAPAAAEDAAAAHVEEEVELGEVLTVDPVSLNLANGRYLRLGLALQMSAEAGGYGEPNTAVALDHAIALFSGRDIAEVTDPAARDALKAELSAQLAESYHGEVVDVYFTEYVTQ